MKTFALSAFALFAVACSGGPTVEKDGGIVMTLLFADPAATDGIKESAAAIVRERMSAAGVRNPVATVSPDRTGIGVELPRRDSVEFFSELATAPGRFEIVECYERDEILDTFFEIDRIMSTMPEYAATENPLFALMYSNSDVYSATPEVGYVPAGRVAELEDILNSDRAKAMLPRGAKPAILRNGRLDVYGEPLHTVVVLRYPLDGRAPVTGNMIEAAQAGKAGYGDEYVVSLLFAELFHDVWAHLTRNNIGRSVALVMDGRVCSAPRVNDEITGGRTQISGDFTLPMAQAVAAILSGGELPTPLTIADVAVITPEK